MKRKYAMVLLGTVIDVIESDTVPHYPPDPDGNPVITMECDNTVQKGDIVENGIIVGTYVPQPTQLDQIQAILDYLAMAIGE